MVVCLFVVLNLISGFWYCQFDPFFIKLEATDGHCSDSLISLGIAKW